MEIIQLGPLSGEGKLPVKAAANRMEPEAAAQARKLRLRKAKIVPFRQPCLRAGLVKGRHRDKGNSG